MNKQLWIDNPSNINVVTENIDSILNMYLGTDSCNETTVNLLMKQIHDTRINNDNYLLNFGDNMQSINMRRND